MSLVSELRRRNVLRMLVLYLVAAWLLMQVAEVLIDLANMPDEIGPIILGLLAIGFPIALIFSWFYEIIPEGISLEKDVDRAESITHVTGRRLDFIVISLLCAAVILFAYDKWWISGPPEQSIAVLPFENMSGDSGQEYFSDGISIELLNLLAPLPGLRVPARTSTFQFKGQNEDVGKIAAALNVAYVLEGSVRRSGNNLRINTQLIKADDGYHLWSASYDREFDDIFAVQDEIARSICEVLKVKLAVVAGEAVLPTSIQAANTDAYDAYLQGRELIRLRGTENLEEAVRHLERSLHLDSEFAPAHAQLAIAIALLNNSEFGYGQFTRAEVKRRATPHLERALELEPGLAEAHGGRALLAGVLGDFEAQTEHARKALAVNPSYSDALNWLPIALGVLGRYEESDAVLEQMLEIDPLSVIGRFNYAHYLGATGRFEEAHEIANQLIAQNRRFGYWAHTEISALYEGDMIGTLSWGLRIPAQNGYVMIIFVLLGEFDEARRFADDRTPWVDLAEGHIDEVIEALIKELDRNPDNQGTTAILAYALYSAGRAEEAVPLFERMLESAPEGRPIPGDYGITRTMRLALARRIAGDEEAAQAAAQIVRQDLAARRASGRKNLQVRQVEAMLAAFDHNSDGAISALRSAIQAGLLDHEVFDDPVFEDLRDEPRFVALQQGLDATLAEEHDKVLQLICFNNPVPDEWQPLPETCEGVEEQRAL